MFNNGQGSTEPECAGWEVNLQAEKNAIISEEKTSTLSPQQWGYGTRSPQ